MATAGCHVDVREGHVCFEVEGRCAVFSHKKKDAVSPHSSLLDLLPLSPEYDIEYVLNNKDPPDSEWISYEDHDQGYVEVAFSAPIPPNKPEVKAPISNDSLMSEYYRFAQVVHSIAPLEGFVVDFDVGIEQVDGSPSDA